MKIGVTLFQSDLVPPPAVVATAAEERGFSSYFIPEHTHIPIARTSPWPMDPGAELPETYSRVLDPYVALASAASVTSTIRLGTGIALVAEHDPVALAKTIATLDHLCGGRFTLGIGFGWNKEEMADHGVAFSERREVTRDYVLAMSALWADDVASYDGKYVNVSASWAWPKPVQRPRPPILLGGAAGPKLFGHIAEWADGWIPVGGGGFSESLPRLHDAWAAAGRSGAPVILPFGVSPNPGKLAHMEEYGVEEVVAILPEADESTILRTLDGYAAFLP